MPRINIDGKSFVPEDGVSLGLWKMDESEAELLSDCRLACFADDVSVYKSAGKRLEYLSVRALLADMLGEVPEISHNSDGKPVLADGTSISISHTRGYAAVILSEKYNVAVDVEYVSDRVRRIADRFLRSDEKPLSTEAMLLCWCAKETIYKLHSSAKLSFEEMRVGLESACFSEGETRALGCFPVADLKCGTSINVDYLLSKMFVLTCAVEKKQ